MLSYVIAFVLGCVFCKFLPELKQRLCAAFVAYDCNSVDPRMEAFKKDIFSSLHDIKSQFPEMQQRNSIKILEIGVGTGTNLQFYPEGCHLIVIDPNPYFKTYYDENIAKFPQIKSEEIIVAKGENMSMVADNSVDVVVITQVLCSVDSIEQILKEILRILVPGGKLYFMEHVREWDTEKHNTKVFFQNWLTKSRIWPMLFDGCELNRDILQEVEKAGFTTVDAKEVYAPIDHPVYRVHDPQLIGNATK